MAKVKEPKDEYRLAYEIVDEKAHVRVFEPIITDEERERRMQKLKQSVRIFLEDYYRREAIREREESQLARIHTQALNLKKEVEK